MIRIQPIVEGYSEVETVPLLLRRLCQHLAPEVPVEVLHPIRVPKSKVLQAGGLEKAVELAGRRTSEGDLILVIVDADTDCPATLGPALLARATERRQDRHHLAVVAKTEFEAWFLTDIEALSGQRGLRPGLLSPADPEATKDAKGWLADHSHPDARYREVIDQPALAHLLHLERARKSPSFDKLYRGIAASLGEHILHQPAA